MVKLDEVAHQNSICEITAVQDLTQKLASFFFFTEIVRITRKITKILLVAAYHTQKVKADRKLTQVLFHFHSMTLTLRLNRFSKVT